MHVHIDRKPPSIAELSAQLHARIAVTGSRKENGEARPAAAGGCLPCSARRERSLRSCHLPAQPKPRHSAPRETGAYVPEMAARLEDDPNLTDGARRCARKLAEYVYRRDRDGKAAEITVTWLMKALRRSRRTVQRYLRQLEASGYISVGVIHAATRMCAGLLVALQLPLLPRHGWPEKSMKSDAPKLSQNNRLRYRTRIVDRQSWALRCMDGVYRSLMKTLPALPPFPAPV